jgi:hypothetical protein
MHRAYNNNLKFETFHYDSDINKFNCYHFCKINDTYYVYYSEISVYIMYDMYSVE